MMAGNVMLTLRVRVYVKVSGLSVLHNPPGTKRNGPACWECMKGCYLFRLDVFYLVTDKYTAVYLEGSCEQECSPR